MSQIFIDIDNDSKQIVITGDVPALCANRFAWGFINSELGATVKDYKIFINIVDRDPTQTLIIINNVMKKNGFTIMYGESGGRVIQEFSQEEENFEEFSLAALNIRNFNGQKDDPDIIAGFAAFKEAVAKHIKTRSLYELQLLSAYHMAFAQNACNFSVPGAGKTSIVYAAYAYLKNLPKDDPKKIDRILIVGPLSSFVPWEMEYEECFGRKPSIMKITGTVPYKDKENYLYSDNPSEITLISYQSVPTLVDLLKVFVRNRVMVVLDEAYKAKNTDNGVIARAVMKLAKYISARIVLTGTPAPNGYQDMYNMFKFIWPNKNIIGFPLNRLRGLTENPDPVLVKKLIDNISPFFIRIRKDDLNLPDPEFHPLITVQMGPLQRQIYDFIEQRYMNEMINESDESVTSKFKSQLNKARIIRLMQAASNQIMLKSPLEKFLDEDDNFDLPIDDSSLFKKIANYEKLETPPKFEAALKKIKEILGRGEKVIVWAIFINTINRFHDFLDSNGINSK